MYLASWRDSPTAASPRWVIHQRRTQSAARSDPPQKSVYDGTDERRARPGLCLPDVLTWMPPSSLSRCQFSERIWHLTRVGNTALPCAAYRKLSPEKGPHAAKRELMIKFRMAHSPEEGFPLCDDTHEDGLALDRILPLYRKNSKKYR